MTIHCCNFPKNKMHWTSIKERSAGFFRLRFMLLIYRIFGRSVLQIFIYPVVFFSVISSKKLRAASRQYLEQIYQKKGQNNFKKPNIFSIFKHVFTFADSLVDRVESWSGNVNLDHLHIKTPEVFAKLIKHLEEKKGAVFISSHLGNIELFRAIGNLKNSEIIDRELKINVIVQSNYTAKFNKIMTLINKNSATNLISATEIDVEQSIILNDKLQNGEILVISGDRTAQNNQDNNLSVNFLGKNADFPNGPIALANVMKVPTYFIFCLKAQGKGQFYELYFYEVDMKFETSRKEQKNNIPILIHEYVKTLENLCLQYPYQWFNFFNFWR